MNEDYDIIEDGEAQSTPRPYIRLFTDSRTGLTKSERKIGYSCPGVWFHPPHIAQLIYQNYCDMRLYGKARHILCKSLLEKWPARYYDFDVYTVLVQECVMYQMTAKLFKIKHLSVVMRDSRYKIIDLASFWDITMALLFMYRNVTAPEENLCDGTIEDRPAIFKTCTALLRSCGKENALTVAPMIFSSCRQSYTVSSSKTTHLQFLKRWWAALSIHQRAVFLVFFWRKHNV